MDSAPSYAPLTRRIYSDTADLDLRRSLAREAGLLDRLLSERLMAAAAWPALRKFLLQCESDRIPTLVYGDYDVDGSVSATLMFRWLRAHGVPANIFLPSRFHHGYGLDMGIMEKAAGQGYKRLLALDCGTTNIDEVAMACSGGLEVAIVDHHTCKDSLPKALLLNPHIDHSLPPLCTAGLVYTILATLALYDGHELVGDELELVGLATIADVVPLEPLNWGLGHLALERMPHTANAGLQELLKVSRLHGLTKITGRQANFDLIPRLNAAGRMAQARMISDLLLADQQKAREIAGRIDRLNTERKEVTQRITEQAHAQALQFGEYSALVLHDGAWHPGVIGIVAARVAEQHGKPTVILADAPGKPELWSGSVRSFGGIDVVSALSECSDHLVSFGGHAAAAGVKVSRASIHDLRVAWHEAVASQTHLAEQASLTSGAEPSQLPEAALGDLSSQFEDDIWSLRPYGPAHALPKFRLKGVNIARADYMGSTRIHIALQVTDGVRQIRLVGFNMSHLLPRLIVGDQAEMVVECEPDNWNNSVGLMLRLVEVT
ncbi:MAG: DHHA1 domain-containing protein [bacterium]|nr:DHHA1 domain-containing protein [bacterium]